MQEQGEPGDRKEGEEENKEDSKESRESDEKRIIRASSEPPIQLTGELDAKPSKVEPLDSKPKKQNSHFRQLAGRLLGLLGLGRGRGRGRRVHSCDSLDQPSSNKVGGAGPPSLAGTEWEYKERRDRKSSGYDSLESSSLDSGDTGRGCPAYPAPPPQHSDQQCNTVTRLKLDISRQPNILSKDC